MPIKEISTRASDPGSSSRAFPWPVLEAGNDSFPNGVYTVTCHDKEAGKSFELRHELRGSTLIEQWLGTGQAGLRLHRIGSPLHVQDAPQIRRS